MQTTMLLSGFGIGWHYEVGMQIVRMIIGGVFDCYPQLKICTGHWGEVVSYYMYQLYEIGKNVTGLKKDVSEYFKENVYAAQETRKATFPLLCLLFDVAHFPFSALAFINILAFSWH